MQAPDPNIGFHAENKATVRCTLRDAAAPPGKPMVAVRHLIHNLYVHRGGYSAESVHISLQSPAAFLGVDGLSAAPTALCVVAPTSNAPTQEDLRCLIAHTGHDAPLAGVLPGGNMRGYGAKMFNAVFTDVGCVAIKADDATYRLGFLSGDTLHAFRDTYNAQWRIRNRGDVPLHFELAFARTEGGAFEVIDPPTDDDAGGCQQSRDLHFLCAYLRHVGLCGPKHDEFAPLTRLFCKLDGAANGIICFAPEVRELVLSPDGADIVSAQDPADTLRATLPNLLLYGLVPSARQTPFWVQGSAVDMLSGGYAARAAAAAPGDRHETHTLTLSKGRVTFDLYALPVPDGVRVADELRTAVWPAFMPNAQSLEGGALLFRHGASELNGTPVVGAMQRQVRHAITQGRFGAFAEIINSATLPYLPHIAAVPELLALCKTLKQRRFFKGNGVHIHRFVFGARNVFVVADAPDYEPNVAKTGLNLEADVEELAAAIMPFTWLLALKHLPASLRAELDAGTTDAASKAATAKTAPLRRAQRITAEAEEHGALPSGTGPRERRAPVPVYAPQPAAPRASKRAAQTADADAGAAGDEAGPVLAAKPAKAARKQTQAAPPPPPPPKAARAPADARATQQAARIAALEAELVATKAQLVAEKAQHAATNAQLVAANAEIAQLKAAAGVKLEKA
jgi:hypothetical protein